MGVIEDNARLRSAKVLRGMVEDAEWYIGECRRMDREAREYNEARRASSAGPMFFLTPPECQCDSRLRSHCEMVLIVASQQEQIAELREQLRRMR